MMTSCSVPMARMKTEPSVCFTNWYVQHLTANWLPCQPQYRTYNYLVTSLCSDTVINCSPFALLLPAACTKYSTGISVTRFGGDFEVKIFIPQGRHAPNVDSSTPNFTPVGAGVGRTDAKTENFPQFRNIKAPQGRSP